MVLQRAKNALQMDDTQYFTFWKQMRQLQQLRTRHQMERRRVINRLAQSMKPDVPVDETALAAQTKELDDLEVQMFQEEQRALSEIDKVLTVYQRARFRVFEENMERQKLDLLARALKGGGDAMPPAASAATPPLPPGGRGGRE
jgi:phytoene dehydrogenase-like protein